MYSCGMVFTDSNIISLKRKLIYISRPQECGTVSPICKYLHYRPCQEKYVAFVMKKDRLHSMVLYTLFGAIVPSILTAYLMTFLSRHENHNQGENSQKYSVSV